MDFELHLVGLVVDGDVDVDVDGDVDVDVDGDGGLCLVLLGLMELIEGPFRVVI